MKTLSLVVLSVILSVAASPLGDRAVFRRHKGVPLSRRHILQSRTDAPAACASLAPPPPTSTSTAPDLTSTALPPVDTTATDNSTTTTDPSLTSNSTIADPTATGNSTTASNSTVANSTTTSNSTATRRFWSRHGFGSSFGFDSSVSSSHVVSVSVSFEETVSTFVQTWEDLCLESGGDIFTNDPCVNFGGEYGIDALSEYADPCDQLDLADGMISFAKSHGIKNRDALINYALSFRAHPRNAVEVLGVVPSSLYCLRAPINPELVGIYNDQIDGVDPGLFGSPNVPMVPFGSSGTCPLGMTADVSSCGCTGGSGSSGSSDSTGCTDCTGSTDASSTDTADLTAPTDATSTDTADLTAPTDATSTDTTDASAATDISIDTSADATATASAVDANVTPTDTVTGPSFQPTNISGNVNDPAGRR